MSENKNYKIIKTTPSNVIFYLHPISNPMLTRLVNLTDEHPVQPVPEDWALGVFADTATYSLFKRKCFTFDDNESITKAAFDAGVYFDDELDFIPAEENFDEKIFEVLKAGNREAILKLINEHGEDIVKDVAIAHTEELSAGVIRMLEHILKIQLLVDGE